MTDIKLAKFARVPPGAAMDKSLSKAALKVLIALCGHANAENLAWPSQSRIALKASISRQRVNAALQELCKRKWIILVIRRKNSRKWSPNVYAINFDRPLNDILPAKQCHHTDDTVSVPPLATLISHPTGDNNTSTIRKRNQRAQQTGKHRIQSPYQFLLTFLGSNGIKEDDAHRFLFDLEAEVYERVCELLEEYGATLETMHEIVGLIIPATNR